MWVPARHRVDVREPVEMYGDFIWCQAQMQVWVKTRQLKQESEVQQGGR